MKDTFSGSIIAGYVMGLRGHLEPTSKKDFSCNMEDDIRRLWIEKMILRLRYGAITQ